ncbi:unnamed protein product [Ectocarpus sp. 12 AP-2014]
MESSSQSQDKQSPLLLVNKPRERLETAPMSPPLSSTRSRSGTGCFFTDEFEANVGHKSARQQCLSISDLDMALL